MSHRYCQCDSPDAVMNEDNTLVICDKCGDVIACDLCEDDTPATEIHVLDWWVCAEHSEAAIFTVADMRW